ncbi:MAG: 5-carboxymethyl-2-hydroxymuconate Delta-isomerase [Cocleimonas sp.]
MPHCIIEYSQELKNEIDPNFLINAAHKGAVDSELFEESHIKSRAMGYEYYKTGASDLRFIHISARILSGRNDEQKANLSQKILARFEALILDKGLPNISITVEVNNLEKESYTKVII